MTFQKEKSQLGKYVTAAPGEVRSPLINPDFARQMSLVENLMSEDREVLRVLGR